MKLLLASHIDEVLTLTDRDSRMLVLQNGKFCWSSYQGARKALEQHFKRITFNCTTVEKTTNLINDGWVVKTPDGIIHYKILGDIYDFANYKLLVQKLFEFNEIEITRFVL